MQNFKRVKQRNFHNFYSFFQITSSGTSSQFLINYLKSYLLVKIFIFLNIFKICLSLAIGMGTGFFFIYLFFLKLNVGLSMLLAGLKIPCERRFNAALFENWKKQFFFSSLYLNICWIASLTIVIAILFSQCNLLKAHGRIVAICRIIFEIFSIVLTFWILQFCFFSIVHTMNNNLIISLSPKKS